MLRCLKWTPVQPGTGTRPRASIPNLPYPAQLDETSPHTFPTFWVKLLGKFWKFVGETLIKNRKMKCQSAPQSRPSKPAPRGVEKVKRKAGRELDGDPGEIRTHDLRIRNPVLYPAELRDQPIVDLPVRGIARKMGNTP